MNKAELNDPEIWAEMQIAQAYDALDERHGWAFLDTIETMLQAGIDKVLIGITLHIQFIFHHG